MATVRVSFRTAAWLATAAAGVYVAVLPPQPSLDFDAWLRTEQSDLAWTQNLPPVYSKLAPGNRNPEPESCQPRQWPTLRRIANQYHPGAAYEMRSMPRPDGSGMQATYDAQGNLIREGLAAGSADRAAPGSGLNLSRIWNHMQRDVIPFIRAAQLDGNTVRPTLFYSTLNAPIVHFGPHLRAYSKVRPTFGPVREIPPGTCIASVP